MTNEKTKSDKRSASLVEKYNIYCRASFSSDKAEHLFPVYIFLSIYFHFPIGLAVYMCAYLPIPFLHFLIFHIPFPLPVPFPLPPSPYRRNIRGSFRVTSPSVFVLLQSIRRKTRTVTRQDISKSASQEEVYVSSKPVEVSRRQSADLYPYHPIIIIAVILITIIIVIIIINYYFYNYNSYHYHY